VQLHGPLSLLSERIGWPEPQSEFARVGVWMEDLCLHKADALMACSANIADFTAARHGVPRGSIEVVYCGVDAERFRSASAAAAGRRPTVLFAGNIVRNKGVWTVLEAVLRLRRKHPAILLRIAGKEEGDLAAEMRALVRKEGAGENVEFVGFVGRDGLPALYQAADVFCSPAQHESGVANVYLEAMACGVPVIASDSGGAAEAIVHGESGWLVPPLAVDAVTDALDRVLGDPPRQRRMGEAARRRVEEFFSMDRYMERVMGVYSRAIADGTSKRQAMEAQQNA
jgi:glycosyltransferase involved in cell wall biosynthesis